MDGCTCQRVDLRVIVTTALIDENVEYINSFSCPPCGAQDKQAYRVAHTERFYPLTSMNFWKKAPLQDLVRLLIIPVELPIPLIGCKSCGDSLQELMKNQWIRRHHHHHHYQQQQHHVGRINTGVGYITIPRIGEFCSCYCLPFLPDLAWKFSSILEW